MSQADIASFQQYSDKFYRIIRAININWSLIPQSDSEIPLANSHPIRYYVLSNMESKPQSPARLAPSTRPQPVRMLASTIGLALLLATLFNLWTPFSGIFTGSFSDKISLMLTAQPENIYVATSQPQLRIGLVAGHAGNDSGAACRDEEGIVTLVEADVNMEIAKQVQDILEKEGYQVDLLNEFDTRLNGYRGVALVSIHNDSCEYINEEATGFKVAAAANTHDYNRATHLT